MIKSKKNKKSRKSKKTRLTRKKQSRYRYNKKTWNKTGCLHNNYSFSMCSLCRKNMYQLGGSGGMCSSCAIQPGFQSGGNPIPGPFVGRSWNAPVNDWPGVNGVGGDRNYLAQNLYHSDPQRMMLLGGNKQNNKNRQLIKNKKNKVGGFIPQDLINLGRDIVYNTNTAYNSLNGYKAPVNPSPYMDQIPKMKTIII
jgi:hypothetical protein